MKRDRDIETRRRSFKWTFVALGLAGVVAVTAATALAAGSGARPFEIVATDRYEAPDPPCLVDCDPWVGHIGTFTSGAPFCESGTVGGPEWFGPHGEHFRRYTCTDGSGSLVLAEPSPEQGVGEWTIAEGSGRYADLRGKGSSSGELLSETPSYYVFRTTLRGFADADAVAPSVAFTKASATKVRRTARTYTLRLALALRDDVEANTVAYRLRVTEGPKYPGDLRRIELASKEGSTATGSFSTKLRIVPSSKRVRTVYLRLTGSDPVGNEVWVARSLKLPR